MDQSLVGVELGFILDIANDIADEQSHPFDIGRYRIDLFLDRHAAFFPALMYLCPHTAPSLQKTAWHRCPVTAATNVCMN